MALAPPVQVRAPGVLSHGVLHFLSDIQSLQGYAFCQLRGGRHEAGLCAPHHLLRGRQQCVAQRPSKRVCGTSRGLTCAQTAQNSPAWGAWFSGPCPTWLAGPRAPQQPQEGQEGEDLPTLPQKINGTSHCARSCTRRRFSQAPNRLSARGRQVVLLPRHWSGAANTHTLRPTSFF